jgi:hypothetical protein
VATGITAHKSGPITGAGRRPSLTVQLSGQVESLPESVGILANQWRMSSSGSVVDRLSDYSQSFMAAKPVRVREYPPLKPSLTNSSLSVMSVSVALSRLRLGPEKHNIWPGIIRNRRKVRSTRCSDVDNKILSRMQSLVAFRDQGAPPFSRSTIARRRRDRHGLPVLLFRSFCGAAPTFPSPFSSFPKPTKPFIHRYRGGVHRTPLPVVIQFRLVGYMK